MNYRPLGNIFFFQIEKKYIFERFKEKIMIFD